MILPNALIAGAPKSGTSSVHQWLAAHPDCVGSDEKETYFMVDPGTRMHRPARHVSQGLAGYGDLFPPAAKNAKIILESTPSYLYSQTALAAVQTFPTPPKVLFILREPAAQIFSLFQYFQNNWSWIPAGMSFAEFLEAAKKGTHDFKGNELAVNCLRYADYHAYLMPWVAALGRDRIKVMVMDDLQRDNVGFTRDVATWFGLDPAFYDTYAFPHENETYTAKSLVLQRANLAIRGLLPKGAVYDRLRRVYRRLNTTKPGPADDDTLRLRARLQQQYAATNARLARDFALDLSRWS